MNIPGYEQNGNKSFVVGCFAGSIINLLGINVPPKTPIVISTQNINHIREHHPDAYNRYFEYIEEIISCPDYVGIAGVYAPSVEFVKRFAIDDEYVNVAVRSTSHGTYFIRSMFIIEEGRLNRYISDGKLKPVDKK